LNLLAENIVFLAIATAFLGVVGWAWRNTKLYDLPQPLPDWFKVWFLTMQIGGGLLPLMVLGWSLWQREMIVASVITSYLVMLGLQILSESLSLRQFRSTVFVMVPYLYIPYRLWQLYQGTVLIEPVARLDWVRIFLQTEIILWALNYALDLSQLPRLFHWPRKEEIYKEEIQREEI
jgi:hypothetical protein